MAGCGTVTEHKMFAKNDPGSGWGCNEGRIKPMPITISNCQTKDGKIIIYASEAKFTEDVIEPEFFGCGGVAQIDDLQNKLIRLARGGFKHHTAICEGHVKEILKEAWDDPYVSDEKIVDVNMRRLRIKVEKDPSNPKHIITVWGLGYRWDE